jgi:phage/plasmid-like protein (TIGR03299 family)
MSHDLEQREIDGQTVTSFVGARDAAWHRLGTVFEDVDGITVAKALQTLDAGEIVATENVQAPLITADGVTLVTDVTKKMTVRVRSTGATPLGVVAQKYQVIQEAEAFGFLDSIVDSGDALVSAAGLLNDGRRAFCTLKLPSNILIGGVDAVDMYLFCVTSHDGTLATTAAATPIRVVCQNTVTAALAGATRTWKVRHTPGASKKIEEARRALDLSFSYEDAFKVEAEALLATKVTKKQYEAMVKVLFPAPAKDAKAQATTAYESKLGTLMGLWSADTQVDIKNTAWGAYNALVEYGDWFRGTRGADDEVAQQFYTSLTSGMGTVRTLADYKDQALTVVKAKAGIK